MDKRVDTDQSNIFNTTFPWIDLNGFTFECTSSKLVLLHPMNIELEIRTVLGALVNKRLGIVAFIAMQK